MAVNLDEILNYEDEYRAVLENVKQSGDNLTARCPLPSHRGEDRNNSFSVNLVTGQWKCFTEDKGGNYVQFYAEMHNIDTKQAYREILDAHGHPMGEKPKERKPREVLLPYTLEEYAEAKHLSADWLVSECGLSTSYDKYRKINFLRTPYIDADGETVRFVRARYGGKVFKWFNPKSSKNQHVHFYGEWRLGAIKESGYCVLCEGESDLQSLWYMGISALGVPGASMFRPEMAETIQGLKIYIHKEPDNGGETFLRKVRDGLRVGEFDGPLYRFSCSDVDGIKDPSDLYIRFGKDDGAAKIKELLRNAEPLPLFEPEVIPMMIKNQPMALRQPEGWTFNSGGIFKEVTENKITVPVLVCATPIIITRNLRNVWTGDTKTELAYCVNGRWETSVLPRDTVFTSRGVITLTNKGCMVSSENAKDIVRFLSALETANTDVIETAESTSVFGWQTNGRFIPGNEGGLALDIDNSARSIRAAYSKSGNLEDWLDVMQPNRENDAFRFILASSFAAPLLRIVGQRGFFTYIWGDSLGGKTAALKSALSVWGNPDGLMLSFNATRVALERRAALFCDLPLGIDERQLAGSSEGLDTLVYMLSSGEGKARGTKDGGVQEVQAWRVIAIGTGEEPLETETAMTGVSNRIIEISEKPFDDGETARKMYAEFPKNHGWAGARYIDWLCHLSETSIRSEFKVMSDFVAEHASGRSASHVSGIAVVALADAMADTLLFERGYEIESWLGAEELSILPKSLERAKAMALKILGAQETGKSADVNAQAAEALANWVDTNASTGFQIGKERPNEEAHGTQYGRYDRDEGIVYILPSCAQEELIRKGFSHKKTLRYLRDRGLLVAASGRLTAITRINGIPTRVYAFRIDDYKKRVAEDGDVERTVEFPVENSETIFQYLDSTDISTDELPF